MPTGYTADVKIDTPFEAFVWKCARAFGALVTMREDSMDAPIPEQLQPDTYHRDRLEVCKVRLAEVLAWTTAEAERDMAQKQSEDARIEAEMSAERGKVRAAYGRMLALAASWHPPTRDHTKLQEFMLQQLQESLRYDCIEYHAPPISGTAAEWKAKAIERAKKDVEYHEGRWAEEQQRTDERNRWIAALRDSLGAVAQ
jgi:hypothetical protein